MDQAVVRPPMTVVAPMLRARRAEFVALLLDTREASAAESLYRRSGWTAFGTVPDYACDPDPDPDRTLAGCVFFYKRLD